MLTTKRIGFVGLGMMGEPMSRCLSAIASELYLYDIDRQLTAQLGSELNAKTPETLSDLGDTCDIVITMLPNADIVRRATLGDRSMGGFATSMAAGAVIIDMSSSYPYATRTLGEELLQLNIDLVDAPVSGGVKKAQAGTLAIMLGGDNAAVLDNVEPVLQSMGSIHRTGGLGSGHAMKALNNYVSAAGLAAACEAVIIATKFGLDPERLMDVINASSGRNNSTETKMKPYVLSSMFKDSGFALNLMAKDVKAAADLSDELDLSLPGVRNARSLWEIANNTLGTGADHTEIFTYLNRHRNRDDL